MDFGLGYDPGFLEAVSKDEEQTCCSAALSVSVMQIVLGKDGHVG